ncbi:MAG: metallophosphoesterase family protein [Cyanobacteria bacterium J06638_20]
MNSVDGITFKGLFVNNSRRIFVGDVHGHYAGLMTLLDVIGLSSDDQIYFLGDLIDRGPNSAAVVKFVSENQFPCLLGNHEQMLLDAFPGSFIDQPALHAWLYSGGQTTVTSYQTEADHLLLQHLEWIRSLPTFLDLGDIWLAHAGVHPKLTLEQQTPHEYCWIRDEFHSMKQPYFEDKLIITGHTITFTLPDVPPGAIAKGVGWIGIDTGAYHPRSGWLTAYDHTNQMVYQVNVFKNNTVRVQPFDQVSVTINPEQIVPRRRRAQMSQDLPTAGTGIFA